jgi:hypothetical protein
MDYWVVLLERFLVPCIYLRFDCCFCMSLLERKRKRTLKQVALAFGRVIYIIPASWFCALANKKTLLFTSFFLFFSFFFFFFSNVQKKQQSSSSDI